MNVHAEDLACGDVLVLHDWTLHIVEVVCDRAVAVLTAEFGFVIHFLRSDELIVEQRAHAA
jgi:hypothetical protein